MIALSAAFLFAALASTSTSTPTPASAQPASATGCALRLVTLLSEGKTNEAAALFAQPRASTSGELQSLVRDVVPLWDIKATVRPRFTRFTRSAVLAPGPAEGASYIGAWVNASSLDGLPLQFHVALAPGQACTVLSIHLDREAPDPRKSYPIRPATVNVGQNRRADVFQLPDR